MRLTLALAALAIPPAHADDAIATDRPDFVESSLVVGKGRFQIETSLARESHLPGQAGSNYSTPTLLRYGIGDALELRLETDGYARLADGTRGWTGHSVGAKWHLADGDAGNPSLGVLLHADLPTGRRALRDAGVRPSIRAVAEWELPHDLSLGVMPGLVWDRDEGGARHVAGILGVVLGKEWNEQWRSFVELAMPRIAPVSHGGMQSSLDVGAAYLLTPRAQLDVAYSHGLRRNSPEHGLTAGLSLKF